MKDLNNDLRSLLNSDPRVIRPKPQPTPKPIRAPLPINISTDNLLKPKLLGNRTPTWVRTDLKLGSNNDNVLNAFNLRIGRPAIGKDYVSLLQTYGFLLPEKFSAIKKNKVYVADSDLVRFKKEYSDFNSEQISIDRVYGIPPKMKSLPRPVRAPLPIDISKPVNIPEPSQISVPDNPVMTVSDNDAPEQGFFAKNKKAIMIAGGVLGSVVVLAIVAYFLKKK